MNILNIFTNNLPIESYIVSVLKRNKNSVEFAFSEIYNKYPFLKKSVIQNVISEILSKKIKGDKISGYWSKVDKKWKLMEGILEMPKKVKGESLAWSGQDLPGSEESNSIGNNLGTYSRPQGQPRNNVIPEPHMQHDPTLMPEEDKEKLNNAVDIQETYDILFDRFKGSIADVNKLNSVILEELTAEFGSKIVRIKLREQI